VKTLLHRAYHLSSSYVTFTNELKFLESFFKNNGYPSFIFHKTVHKFLNTLYDPPPKEVSVRKDTRFVSLPFLGPPSSKIVNYLKQILPTYYPQIEFKFSLKNNFKIQSYFRYKDTLPVDLRSNFIYKYTCGSCHESYIGSSVKQTKVRFTQHLGTSFRTNRPLTVRQLSTPRNHAEHSNHPILYEHFSVIDSCTNQGDLRILESIHIAHSKPSLNIDKFAAPLFLVTS
jgi:hypothetical protein